MSKFGLISKNVSEQQRSGQIESGYSLQQQNEYNLVKRKKDTQFKMQRGSNFLRDMSQKKKKSSIFSKNSIGYLNQTMSSQESLSDEDDNETKNA